MKIYYASRMGHVEALVKAIDASATKIESGDLKANEEFILFTYTDGHGIVPPVVEEFLSNNGDLLNGVVVSGNKERHAETYCVAGDIISEKYNVPCLYKVDGSGTEEDVAAIAKLVK